MNTAQCNVLIIRLTTKFLSRNPVRNPQLCCNRVIELAREAESGGIAEVHIQYTPTVVKTPEAQKADH